VQPVSKAVPSPALISHLTTGYAARMITFTRIDT
jgi:hypothetical protein